MVFTALALIAAISIPQCSHARIGAGETSPMGTLKAISAGQEQFRSAALVDANRNGIGEYGFLVELSGNQNCRISGINVANSPYIPGVFNASISKKSGYCFSVFICNSDDGSSGTSVYSTSAGTTPRQSKINEENYIAYAWPETVGKTGYRVYAISPQGTVMQNPNGTNPVTGTSNPPVWSAAITGAENWTKGRFVKPGETGFDPDLPLAWAPIG